MKQKKRAKVIVVMPAYNAEKTLAKTYHDIPKKLITQILVIDDDSQDETVNVAKQLGLTVVVHSKNLGYGGNQKTCYTEALQRQADVVVMIHPDYQYDASLTEELIRPVLENRFDIMLGSRIRTRQEALTGGMPLYKYIGNRFLTLLENILLGLNLSEYHTGFRAFHRNVLETVPYHLFSNNFVFDQQILIAASSLGFTIGETSVPVRYFAEASSINFLKSVRYGFETVFTVVRFILHKLKLVESPLFKPRKFKSNKPV